MNLVPFNYNNKEVRVITDEQGNPWWVAKDVCDVLDHTNPTVALEMLEEDERSKQSLGRQGETNLINESGLYTLIMRSKKEEAKKFRKWVTAEVLPTLRKTGSYNVQPSTEHLKISNCFEDMLRLADLLGLQGNQKVLSANHGVKKLLGVAPLELVNLTHLDNPTVSSDLTPTAIGELIGISNRQVNQLLTKLDYQTPIRSGKHVTYVPTDKAKHLVVFKDTTKKHKDGTPILQMFWKQDIVEHLKEQ